MAYTRLNPQPTGYNSSSAVNLLNYSEGNPYTAPADGIVRIECNYRANAYTQAFIKTGNQAAVSAQASQSANGGTGNISSIVPVFKGQKMWAALNPNVQYGLAQYMPYTY